MNFDPFAVQPTFWEPNALCCLCDAGLSSWLAVCVVPFVLWLFLVPVVEALQGLISHQLKTQIQSPCSYHQVRNGSKLSMLFSSDDYHPSLLQSGLQLYFLCQVCPKMIGVICLFGFMT